MFKRGHLHARRTYINAAPELWEFDDYLSCDKCRDSRFFPLLAAGDEPRNDTVYWKTEESERLL
jgi:hypothetical protein